ncbi:MAG: hypothetical protein AB1798_17650, partial [Spirochaetota bacterium]
MGVTDKEYAQKVESLLKSYGYILSERIAAEAFISAMRQDKKKRGGKLRLVLQRNLCDTFVETIDASILSDFLEKFTC